MNKLTPEQRVYEELTKYLWDIGIELEEHESDKIAKILNANTAEDEPNHHCKECRDSWLFGQMTRPAQKEYTRQVGNQIALRKWKEFNSWLREQPKHCMAFPDWLQQEDEDETTNT